MVSLDSIANLSAGVGLPTTMLPTVASEGIREFSWAAIAGADNSGIKWKPLSARLFGVSLPVPCDRGKWVACECRGRTSAWSYLSRSGTLKSHEWSRAVVILTATLVIRTQLSFLPHKTPSCRRQPSCWLFRVLVSACRWGARGTSDVLVHRMGLATGPMFEGALSPSH